MLAKNKKIILFLFSLFLISHTFAKNHLLVLNPDKNWIKGAVYLPGDTIFVTGTTASLTFNDLQGTKENPILIINQDQVRIIYSQHGAFRFKNCKHVIVNGKGNPNIEYGFYVAKTGESSQSAIGIMNLSTDMELFGIEIASSGFAGIMAKTNPDKNDPRTWRENFTMNNMSIHDNYIHDTDGEGMYIGFHSYGDQNGIKAHAVKNAKIYNNIVKNTGWDGIQLACGDENSEIYNNQIDNAGRLNQRQQRSGMSINSGFNGKIYNNTICVYNGSGISILPLDSAEIYNNEITSTTKMGIYVQMYILTNDDCKISIHDNTICAETGIMVHHKDSSVLIKEFLIKNNTIKADTTISYNYKRFWLPPSWLKINN